MGICRISSWCVRFLLSYSGFASVYINWRPFFIAWKLDGSLASVADVQGCGHCMAQWLAGMPEHKRAKAAEAMQLYKGGRQGVGPS